MAWRSTKRSVRLGATLTAQRDREAHDDQLDARAGCDLDDSGEARVRGRPGDDLERPGDRARGVDTATPVRAEP